MVSTNKKYKAARLNDYNGVQISRKMYNLIIGGVVLWGVFLNVFMAMNFANKVNAMNPLVMLAIYLIGTIVSMIVIYKSHNFIISFLFYNVLAFSMGLILTYVTTTYEIGSILNVFMATALFTGVMIALSIFFTDFFRGIGRILFISLVVGILAEFIVGFLLTGTIMTDIVNFGMVLVFCGFIGYDWARAQDYPPTVDNAIDSAADIYIDVVNLFLNLLQIFGHDN